MPTDRLATYSPADLAERYKCKPEKVIAWIRAGELAVVNVGNGTRKPRWRVTAEALADFERRRASPAPAAAKATRRRRRAPAGIIEFF